MISMPSHIAATLKDMFHQSDQELKAFRQRMREEVLDAAATLQYDAATLPGKQLKVSVLDEPFTKRQQLKGKLDGRIEMDGHTQRLSLIHI